MTNKDLGILELTISQAVIENKKRNYIHAEKLCNEVLSFLQLQTSNVDDQSVSQVLLLKIRTCCLISESLWRRGNTNEALQVARQALDELPTDNCIESKEARVAVYVEIGNINYTLANYTIALEYFQRTLNLLIELGDKTRQANITGNIGTVYKELSDYKLSLECYFLALQLSEEMGDKPGISNRIGNIGTVYYCISDFPMALEYYEKAIQMDEEIGEKEGLARHLNNIGVVYKELSDPVRALEYFNKGLVLSLEIGNKSLISNNYCNIGSLHTDAGVYSEALKYYLKALAIDEETGNKDSIARIYGNMGVIYEGSENFVSAMEYYQKALAIRIELGNKSGIARQMGNVGNLFSITAFEGYDAVKGEEYLLRAISLFEELGVKFYLYDCHNYLARLYKHLSQWEKYSYHYECYHNLMVEVQNNEAKSQAELIDSRRKIEESERDRQVKIARFQEQEKILHNILPAKIADRMVSGEMTIVDSYDSVSVLFADIVGFTKLSQRVTPEELVAGLGQIFNTFDLLADKHGCEKIKTIGDCYMVVAGLPERCDNHAERLGLMALDMLKAIEEFPEIVEDVAIKMRIGIHSGSVVAGIIGKNKYAYDLWGDAVNTASRMESHGEAGKIHVSEDYVRTIISKEISQRFVSRGDLTIKGKGTMRTYFLE